MQTWVSVMIQEVDGCDYTIGCGYKVKYFLAKDLAAAQEQAIKMCYMEEYFNGEADPKHYLSGERTLQSWTLYQVSEAFDMLNLLRQAKNQHEAAEKAKETAAQEAHELAEYQRLQKKYGNNQTVVGDNNLSKLCDQLLQLTTLTTDRNKTLAAFITAHRNDLGFLPLARSLLLLKLGLDIDDLVG